MPGLLNSYTFGAAGPATYNSVVNALSPTGRWKLDDTSGTAAAAAAGSNGTYVGTPTLAATGLISDGGTAVTMDGNTQEVTVPVSFGSAGSILFTFSSTDISSSVLFRDHSSTAGTFLQLGSGIATPVVRVNGGNRSITPTVSSNSLRDGSKHMVLLTSDGTTATLYIDGVQVDQWLPTNAALSGMVSPLHFGRNGTSTGTTNFYAATYDDVAVFSTVLTSTDAAAIWAVR